MSPKNIQLVGDTLAIVWDDESESYIPCEFLRRQCPCAGCGGERDVLGHEYKGPPISYKAESFKLLRFQLVGGYAVGFDWQDGHNTGIYTYEFLKKLGAAAGG